eukprot:CAMPEP_0119352244 /NCGR_PEP_ID=MMETSP1334-20130426/1540_1 /TAXON_ID=127549 /ORGANISM="Calcidiscus leptoporus, Strain RCC1130" /LENGTH=390 /DNA_ID=CAMNT_0007365241 /DNA_START=122 /DNA_END=1294 /DNA_ORIENTATION=+
MAPLLRPPLQATRALCTRGGGRGKGAVDLDALLGPDVSAGARQQGAKPAGAPMRGRGLSPSFEGLDPSTRELTVVRLPPRGGGQPLPEARPDGRGRPRVPPEAPAIVARGAGRGDLRGSYERVSTSLFEDPQLDELDRSFGGQSEVQLRRRGQPRRPISAPASSEVEEPFATAATDQRRGKARRGARQQNEDNEPGEGARRRGRRNLFIDDDDAPNEFEEGVSKDEVEDMSPRLDIAAVHAHLMETAHVLPMKTPKLRGLAKLIAAEEGTEPPKYDMDSSLMGLKRADFEPHGPISQLGVHASCAIDSMLAVREEHAELLKPAPGRLSAVEQWYTEIGVPEGSAIRSNERFDRVLRELSDPKYTEARRVNLAREFRRQLRLSGVELDVKS